MHEIRKAVGPLPSHKLLHITYHHKIHCPIINNPLLEEHRAVHLYAEGV